HGAITTQNLPLNPLPPTSGCRTDTTQAAFQAGSASSILLDMVTSPGDVRLRTGSAGSQSDQSCLADFTGAGFTNTNWAAQSFTPTVTGQLTRVDLFLFCSGCSGA